MGNKGNNLVKIYKIINNKYSFVILLALLILNSCSLTRVFGLKKDEFMSRVNQGDYRFLDNVDYLKNSIKEINRLGDGASYYMSFVYKERNQLLFSNKLLYQEIQNRDDFFGPKAAFLLIKQLLQERDYVKAELHAVNFFETYDGDYPEITKQLIEAMYWQKKNQEVITYIDNLDRSLYSTYANNELDLLRTVAKARMDIVGWEDDYKNLFMNQPLSPLLKRAYSFINVYPDYARGFSREEERFFYLISLASSGDYTNAQRILRPLLETETWIFDTTQSIKNCSRIIKSSRYITTNLGAFSSAMNSSLPERRFDALVSYASLYFNKESFSSVVNLLEDALDDIPLGSTRDDALWLYMLSLSHVGRDRIVAKMTTYLDTLTGETYAPDIIDHVITALVQNSEWELLVEIRDLVNEFGSLEEQSRLTWIISRIYHHDYIVVHNKNRLIEDNLDLIITSDDFTYYSYMANALMNRESNVILDTPPVQTELDEDNSWISGFLEYGLVHEAVTYARHIDKLNYSLALDIANRLDAGEEHLETLRFLSRSGIDLNSETFPLYYPLPYKTHITDIANRYNFSPALFSGLIRTESGFDMHVVSSAGAVGMTQLLPATANEQAADLGMGIPDLNDPEINILLGGTYLDWAMDRFYTLPVSCMAYNAGPMNVWDWQDGWGDLPDELFIEAAPFKETRNYVPKIVKAAIYYGHEHFGASPYNVVTSIFENID